jgi:hypothetical protein
VAEREKLRAQQARDNEKALTEILDAKQALRFKQVILQHFAITKFRGAGALTYARIAEVVDGLKLSKEQREQLQQGTEITKVLDASQQARWREMLGEPFEMVASLTPRLGGFAASGGAGGNKGNAAIVNIPLQYLNYKSVQDDLRLTDEQKKKLPELSQKWNDLSKDLRAAKFGGRVAKGDAAERTKKLAEARSVLDKAIAGVLDAKQILRLDQIQRQQTQKLGQGTLLANAKVRQVLALSDDQIKKLAEVADDAKKTNGLIRTEFLRGSKLEIDDVYSKTLAAHNKLTESKCDAVLTTQQRDTLRALLGAPFKGDLPRFFFNAPFDGGGFPG